MRITRSVAVTSLTASLWLVGSGGLALAQEPSESVVQSGTSSNALLDAYRRLHASDELLAQLAPGAGRPVEPAAESGEATSMAEINRQLNNPVSSIWSLNFQNNFVFSEGSPSNRERWFYNLNFQPVLPLRLTEDWNLITRPVFPVLAVVDVPELSGGGLRWTEKSGLGDIALLSLLSPKSGESLLWGVGPSFIFPSASDNALGQGKWQAGPAAVVLHLGKEWIFGALAQQWWSFAGDSNRPDTSQANIQYFIQYILPDHWQVGLAPNVTVNWKADGGNKLNFPIGLGVGKLVRFGKLPVKFTVEIDYSVIKPDDFNQRWLIRFQMIPVLPALIKDPLIRW
jgi:hypothetical protein